MSLMSRWRCPHTNVRGVYGDEIIFGTPNWNRLRCLDCGRFLNGPVMIAEFRKAEATAVAALTNTPKDGE